MRHFLLKNPARAADRPRMRTRLLLSALLVTALIPSAAQARVPRITKSVAAVHATLEIYDYATHKCHIQPEGCDAAAPDPISKYDCRQSSRTVMSCPATIQLLPVGDALFPDQCEATIKVTRRSLLRYATRVTRWECF